MGNLHALTKLFAVTESEVLVSLNDYTISLSAFQES